MVRFSVCSVQTHERIEIYGDGECHPHDRPPQFPFTAQRRRRVDNFGSINAGQLGKGTKQAGACGVLRVVISYPTPLDRKTLDSAPKGKHQALATVAVDHLEPPESKLGQTILGLANLALGGPDRKRNSSEEIDGTRPKKPKKRGSKVRG
jgi:hypothetical protein